MNNYTFARFERAFFIFVPSQAFSRYQRREMTSFAVVWTTRALDDKRRFKKPFPISLQPLFQDVSTCEEPATSGVDCGEWSPISARYKRAGEIHVPARERHMMRGECRTLGATPASRDPCVLRVQLQPIEQTSDFPLI